MLRKADQTIWTGRTDHHSNRSSFRYHQIIEMGGLQQSSIPSSTCALIGFECEEGVRRNKGRLGAASAPNALREELAKLPWKQDEQKRLIDLGNITCQGNDLAAAQSDLGTVVSGILSSGAIPIILGGGHETAYGHYLGIRKFIGKEATLGIVNIDAHFDLRSYDEQPSSGTMFRQILEQDEKANYFVVGIQRYGNTQELFDRADKLGATYVYEEDMTADLMGETVEALETFIANHDYVMLTLCTDVLNAAFAPGVSAPSPFGLDPSTVRTIIRTVTSKENALSFDISEVNPLVDENNRTVKLGAYLTNEAITTFLGGNQHDNRT